MGELRTAPHDRHVVFIGIMSAWVASIVWIGLGIVLLNAGGVTADWSAAKAAGFAITLAAFALAAGLCRAAQTRHMCSNIDGSRPETESRLDILLRYVTNTTEQLVLFVIAAMGFAAALPNWAPRVLPVMGAWFVIARAAFFIGYQRNPLARAFGFAGTFHPTVALLVVVLLACMF